MSSIDALRAFLRPLARRIALLASPGQVGLSDDAGSLQTIQAQFLKTGETRETRADLARMGEFGWSSRPPQGSELVAIFFNGSRDHGVVIAAEDRASRPRGLEEGESCAYNAHGVSILLKKDGSVAITAPGGVTISGPSIEIEGDLKVGGKVEVDGTLEAQGKIASASEVADPSGSMEEMRQAYNLHTHAGVTSGSASTAPPAPPMT